MNDLEQRVLQLEFVFNKILKSDRFFFERLLQIDDGRNVQLGRNTGTIIGTAADQKLGFWGKTPVVQPTAVTHPTLIGSAQDGDARVAIDLILVRLENTGIFPS